MTFPNLTLPQLLEQTVTRFSQNTALIYFDQKLSYSGLHDHVQRAAVGLQALGVQPGDRVALMMANCPQLVIAFYATLRAGGVVTATCPIYTAREAGYRNSYAKDCVPFIGCNNPRHKSGRRLW